MGETATKFAVFCVLCVASAVAALPTHMPGTPAGAGLAVLFLCGILVLTDVATHRVPDLATVPFAVLPLPLIWWIGGPLLSHLAAGLAALVLAAPLALSTRGGRAALGSGDLPLLFGCAAWLGPAIWDGLLAGLLALAFWLAAGITVTGRLPEIPFAVPMTAALLYAWPPGFVP